MTNEEEVCHMKVKYKSDIASIQFRNSDTWSSLGEHVSKALPSLSECTLSHFVIVDNDGEAESNELRSMAKLLKAYHKIYKPADMYFEVFTASTPSKSPPAPDEVKEVRQFAKK